MGRQGYAGIMVTSAVKRFVRKAGIANIAFRPVEVLDLAEGQQGAFDGYDTIVKPQATAQTIALTYRHENGATFPATVTVGAASRATVTIPAWVPAGSVGVSLTAPLGVAVERSMYGGTTWTVGHSGVASPVGARRGASPKARREASTPTLR